MATAEEGESATDGATETPATQEAADSGASGAAAPADAATPAADAVSSTTTAVPASGAPARQPRLSMGLMMTRQMEEIKRQKARLESGIQRAGVTPRKVPPALPAEASSAPSAQATEPAPATVAQSPPAKSITPNSPAAKAMASHLSAAVSAASGAPADKALASGRPARLKIVGNTAARRLGVPLKGSTMPVWKRLKVTGGSVKIASAARPAKAKAETGVRGRGAVKAGAARAAIRAASGRASDAAAAPRSGVATRRARAGAPGLSGALRAAAGALRAATGAPQTAVSRPAKSAPVGSRLAAAARAAVARQPARPGRRPPGAVRPGGVFGAIMVKKQEDSDREEDIGRKGMAPKVKAPSSAPRAAASRADAATRIPARRALGYGYGDVSAESDESIEATAVNGKSKPQMRPVKAEPAPARGGARPDLRGRNILGKMMGHLASAKRRLSDEQQGRPVKEEPVRWEAKESEDEEPEAPPAKRVRRKEREPSASDDKKSEEEQEADDESEPEDGEQDPAKADRAELAELQKRLEAHYSLMKNFIRTRAEPTIFFLPAKHNSQTKRMLKETRLAIEQKISSLRVHLQPSDASDEEAASEAGSSAPSASEDEAPKAPAKRKARR